MSVRLPIRIARRGGDYDWQHLCQSFATRVQPEHTVLEIGASVPARTAWLAERCSRVIGVELYPDRVPEPPMPNITYVVGDWQRLSDVVAPNSIDVAVSSHVIEHVPDDARAIDELHQVLRPGGMAIITTPNRKRLVRALIESVRGERQFPWWEHVREYTERDLESLVGRSRFGTGEIEAVALGIHGGPMYCYLTAVPAPARRFANFWELCLRKRPFDR